MSNASIRTMQDDIEESRAEKSSSASSKTNNISSNSKTILPNQSVKKENIEKIIKEIKPEQKIEKMQKPATTTAKFSKTVNNAQSNDLKSLINRISEQTEKDTDNESDLNLNKQEETNISSKSKQGIAPINTKTQPAMTRTTEENNKNSADNKNIHSNDEIINDLIVEEKEKDNTGRNKDIADLKKLIDRISKTPNKDQTEVKKAETHPIDDIKTKSQEINQKIQNNDKQNVPQVKEKLVIKKILDPNQSIIKNNISKPVPPMQPVNKVSTQSAVQAVKKTSTQSVPLIIEHETPKPVQPIQPVKEGKASFWSKISRKKKTSVAKKISDLTPNNQTQKNKTNNDIIGSGVLQSNQELSQKREKKRKLISKYYKEDYIAPFDRLSREKQQLYSSLSKRINLKREKGELDALKKIEEGKKKKKIVNKDEEYKKLKKSIRQKYHIKLFLLPWKKIIVFSLVFLIAVGAGIWILLGNNESSVVTPIPVIISGEEINDFSAVQDKITVSENDYNVTQLELDAINIFSQNEKINTIKLELVENNDNQKMVTFKKALEIIGIKNDKTTLPSDFLGLASNSYNIFIFKTSKKPLSIRYGIAVKSEHGSEIQKMMKKWEENRIENQKMMRILKPLFIDDSGFTERYNPFSSVNYSKENINLRYVGINGSETAIDYFVYKNILVITTSKDSILVMADLLIN